MRFGIFQKILLTTLCVSLIPLAIIWYLDHNTTQQLTGERIDQQLTSFAGSLATHVDDWVDMNQRMLQQNAQLRDIRQGDAATQTPILQSIIRSYPWTYLAFTVDRQGNNVGRSDAAPLKYYGDRNYVRQVLDGEPFGEQILIGKTSGKPALVLSTGIPGNDGKPDGVIAIAMTLSELSDTITRAHIGRTGFAFLLDQKGEVIAHRNTTFTQSRADFSSHPAFIASQRGQKRLVFTDENGVQLVAGMVKTRQGWTLIVQQEAREAYAPVHDANRRALTLLAVTLVLVLVSAYLLSLKLATPIRSLTVATDQLSQGKIDIPVTGLQRRDEIGDLARAIDRLGTSIKVAMKRLQRS